jgi:drug/metabolite transporter (DMT)-like permease
MAPLRTVALTLAALLAFAANSVLCRLALQQGGIDPASFGSLRLVAGALTLALVLRLRPGGAALRQRPSADWLAALMLFAYVAFFSFAYLSLAAGTGALILFGAVQLSMLAAGWRGGEAFGRLGTVGFLLALGGLAWLVAPGVSAPAPLGAAAMALAGVAWGVYSLRGRGVTDPLAATAGNFLRAAPLALGLSLLLVAQAHADLHGVLLAIASGALTSGIGYVIWYAALPGLSALSAATVQLAVPLLAALGGVAFLGEAISGRLAGAGLAILGGIALVLLRRARRPA